MSEAAIFPGYMLTETERQYLVEQVTAALGECMEAEDVSESVAEGLVGVLEILGVKYERTSED